MKSLGQPFERLEVRAFDGDSFLQVVVSMSFTTLPVIVAWIRARAERSKSTVVVADGIELRGYTPAEIDRIVSSLERRASED